MTGVELFVVDKSINGTLGLLSKFPRLENPPNELPLDTAKRSKNISLRSAT